MNFINKEIGKKGILLDEGEPRNELELYLESMDGQYLLTPKDRKVLIEKVGVKSTKGKLIKRIDTINSILDEDDSKFRLMECRVTQVNDGVKKVYAYAWQVIRRIIEKDVSQ